MSASPRKTRKLSTKLLVPLILIAVLYLAVIVVLMRVSGVFSLLSDDALEMLDERTQNKQLSLQDELSGYWSSLDTLSEELMTAIRRELRLQGATTSDIAGDAALNAEIVSSLAPLLLTDLRATGANGIFLILNGIGVANQPGSYAGLYLRDSEPETVVVDNSDVMLERGLPPVSRSLGLPLDSYWRASFTFTDNDGAFFFQPMQAALEGTSRKGSDYGQWTGPFTLSSNDMLSIVTYSIPLIDTDGTVVGVLGTEAAVSHLSAMLNKGELSRTNPGCYLLATSTDGESFRCVASAGTLFRQQFDVNQDTLVAEKWINGSTMELTGSRSGQRLYASVRPLNLSGTGSGERWYVIGIQTVDMVMSFANRFSVLMAICCAITLLLAILIAFIASWRITSPVTRLIRKLQSGRMNEETLDTTRVREIDILAQEIIRQSNYAAIQSQRLNRVLSLTGTLLGVYEIRNDDEQAFCSRGVFQAFGMVYDERLGSGISRTQCRHMLDTMLTDEVDRGVFRVRVNGNVRYLRHRQLTQTDCTLGTLTDVTNEMEYRYRVEYERDYDVLTGLLNRRAFAGSCRSLFEQPGKLGIAAVIMMDLDNLKFLNDTYGHDTGDSYICCFAKALSAFGESACVYGRRSGDEFYALLYGWESREALERFAQEKWQEITSATLPLSDGTRYRVHVSGGMAWYPDDSTDFDTLIHYADYAMYQVKQGNKGILSSFDASAYTDYAHMMSGRNALNRLLDNRLVRYVFQPIASAVDGGVLGYELLMRPQVPELPTPGVVLRLAKAQGMLHHVERMTWMCALEAADTMNRQGRLPAEAHLFVNSIANQMLNPEEEALLTERFQHLFHRVVVEVTEGEANCTEYTQHKQAFVQNYGGRIAIDDFGTGYNSEIALMMFPCDYVKLDTSFVRNVDTDRDRQAMAVNLISYAHRKNIAVICEGVETADEMATLIACGADYLQGYYLGRPTETPQPLSEDIRAQIVALRSKG